MKEYTIENIKKLYEQALVVMKYMQANNEMTCLWDELSYDRAIYFLNDQLIFEDYEQLITPLINKDESDDTELVYTLYIYLKKFFSYTEAAKVLYVHPNTVKYRLKQISKLLGHIDFRENQQYLDLMLAIKLYFRTIEK